MRWTDNCRYCRLYSTDVSRLNYFNITLCVIWRRYFVLTFYTSCCQMQKHVCYCPRHSWTNGLNLDLVIYGCKAGLFDHFAYGKIALGPHTENCCVQSCNCGKNQNCSQYSIMMYPCHPHIPTPAKCPCHWLDLGLPGVYCKMHEANMPLSPRFA